ncbi:serine/threonine-protein kinase HipA [Leucobacter exalbidus]|uniref:Serine/threonine-protein kinase HipA n=1 Tax=Leucobacter exalbidus TaxID=662960 RepID=A0A940SZI9_9MICO|nr:HipA domain-containing protein [Leucobacter exalbidus]MBP1324945.1 serine/threonine-protein kinase HipA [Leucobacter exalbidus]
MPEALEVFKNGTHIGLFIRESDGRINFVYNADAPETPISLSLPRHGAHTKRAAENFLRNLLPDNDGVRARWARHLNTADHPFDLLKHTGEDVAGALSLLPEGSGLGLGTSAARLASSDEIADRIASLMDDRDAWIAPEHIGKVRMSLAGAQGKFTLTQVDETWFWSSAVLPSTHIFKPAFHDVESAPEFEAGSLALARAAGISAPKASGVHILGQHTYVVERFDRRITDGVVTRIHTEDFAQAAGRDPGQKYGMSAAHLFSTLREHSDEESQYQLAHMLIFNTAIGNSDAHGKNYSVFLDGGVRVAPLYDAIPTTIWPKYDEDKLAMKIGGAERSPEVQAAHWAKLARANMLDEDRIVALARSTYTTVADQGHDIFRAAGVSGRMLAQWDRLVASTTRHLSVQQPATIDMALSPKPVALRRGDHESATPLSTRDLGLELDLGLDLLD